MRGVKVDKRGGVERGGYEGGVRGCELPVLYFLCISYDFQIWLC